MRIGSPRPRYPLRRARHHSCSNRQLWVLAVGLSGLLVPRSTTGRTRARVSSLFASLGVGCAECPAFRIACIPGGVLGTGVAACSPLILVPGCEGWCTALGVPRPLPGLPKVPWSCTVPERCCWLGVYNGYVGVRGKRPVGTWERGGTSWPPVALPLSHVNLGERHHCGSHLSEARGDLYCARCSKRCVYLSRTRHGWYGERVRCAHTF